MSIVKAELLTVLITGNHDVTLDPEFYAKHGQGFHGNQLEDTQQCMQTVKGSTPSLVWLQHQAATIRLARADGPRTIFKVFGSPYSQFQGKWAFGYDSSNATALWDKIPLDTDIIVSHTPPRSHCDQKPDGKFVGCEALRQTLNRIRPPLAVCGHVHEGRGYERACWRPALVGTRGGADSLEHLTRGVLPPFGSKKQCLVDLTGKRADPLDNEGFSGEFNAVIQTEPLSPASGGSAAPPVSVQGHQRASPAVPFLTAGSLADYGPVLQTLRKETCIVNAAIVATSWPHRGGKRFNAPIVVDLELPVWQGENASPITLQCI